MRRRSYRYRPNKVQSAVGIAAGGLFILLGLFFVIPTFGFFGIIWTLFAVGITASNAYAAFSGKGYGSLEMEERDGPAAWTLKKSSRSSSGFTSSGSSPARNTSRSGRRFWRKNGEPPWRKDRKR